MRSLFGNAIVCIVLLSGCSKQELAPEPPVVSAQEQAVAMPDQFAADVAMQIMDAGGNAVDAAIAAQFSLAVTYPEAGNIGGGGFMLTYMDGKTNFLDYRETAPSGASRDMYLNEQGEVVSDLPVYGILASGVPGTVAGMWAAHKKHGSLPWEDLVAPAIRLAEEGFVMPSQLFERIEGYQNSVSEKDIDVNFADYFGGVKTGEKFVQQELASTLKRIQMQGADGFYKGETAKHIVDFMNAKNGLITEQDLAAYNAKWREPIITQWREFTVVSASPPSSGGIAIAQWLQMYDRVKARSGKIEHNSQQYMHVLAEIGKRVFADRAEYLGDPDFYEVPKSALLAADYLDSRAAEVNLEEISNTENVKPGLDESHDTTHFSIVDRFGNAVSNTTTINLSFGSGMVVEGAGFLLNNEMDDFSAKSGVANSFGAVGGDANAIAPNKRMLSSMSPTILLEDEKIKLVTGSPGGTTIISSVYLSILNAIEFDMSAQKIVDSPRFHHQLLPKDTIYYHDTLADDVVTALQEQGYVMRAGNFGDLQVIVNTKKGLEAASESRNRGSAEVTPAESGI
jgi:gamma-glutamyltranspeptidase/glutathione hydrolase